jgi:hypothetical protein
MRLFADRREIGSQIGDNWGWGNGGSVGAERRAGSMGWDDGGGGDNPRAGEPAAAAQVGLGGDGAGALVDAERDGERVRGSWPLLLHRVLRGRSTKRRVKLGLR